MGFWRWITGALTVKQKAVIEKQYYKLEQKYEDEATHIRNKNDEYADRANKECPKCGSKKNIIDKIAHVQGSGKVSGDFSLGFGSIRGSSNVDTSAVNHCSVCGHEWVKDIPTRKYAGDLISHNLDMLGYIFDDNEWSQKYTVVYVEKFSEYYAETIQYAYKENSYRCAPSTEDQLTLKNLKKHFKSVRDE